MLNSNKSISAIDFDLIVSYSPGRRQNKDNIFNNQQKNNEKILLMQNLTPNNKRSRMFKKCQAIPFPWLCFASEPAKRRLGCLAKKMADEGRQNSPFEVFHG